MEEKLYELQQRLNWFIDGIGIHGLSWDLFNKIPTDRIVELYNVEAAYFKK
jgi:hypothetical protein